MIWLLGAVVIGLGCLAHCWLKLSAEEAALFRELDELGLLADEVLSGLL